MAGEEKEDETEDARSTQTKRHTQARPPRTQQLAILDTDRRQPRQVGQRGDRASKIIVRQVQGHERLEGGEGIERTSQSVGVDVEDRERGEAGQAGQGAWWGSVGQAHTRATRRRRRAHMSVCADCLGALSARDQATDPADQSPPSAPHPFPPIPVSDLPGRMICVTRALPSHKIPAVATQHQLLPFAAGVEYVHPVRVWACGTTPNVCCSP